MSEESYSMTHTWSQESNPPGRGSLLGGSLMKNPEEEDPPWRITPKIDQFWGELKYININKKNKKNDRDLKNGIQTKLSRSLSNLVHGLPLTRDGRYDV